MKQDFISDAKQFWHDLKRIYPAALSTIISKWQWTIACLLIILSCFYLDGALRSIILSMKSESMDNVMDFGRWYGNGQPVYILFFVLYLYGLFANSFRTRDTGLMILESYVFSGLLTLVFKSVFGRWRPYTNHGDLSFDGFNLTGNDYFSYFSGHSQAAFAVSVIIASMSKNIYVKILFYAFAVITAISRIYHDQHWLSDVVTGAMVAFLFGKMVLKFHHKRLFFSDPSEKNSIK